MHDSYRLTIRNASTLKVVEAENGVKPERLAFGACFMIWMGLIASTWAAIAFVFSLL